MSAMFEPNKIITWKDEVASGQTIKLQYPSSEHLTDNTWSVFRFVKYSYADRKDFVTKQKLLSRTVCVIRLPLPAQMKHSYSTQINTLDLGPVADAIAKQVGGNGTAIMGGNPGAAWDAAVNVGRDAARSGSALQNAMITSVVRNVIDGVGNAVGLPALDIVSAAGGVAINNNTGAVFKGVNLRQFEFAFNLFPESEQDAITVRNIVNAFRYFMHPDYANEYVFNYPHLVNAYFETGNEDNSVNELHAYRVYPAFITNLNIDHSGDSRATFHYEDGEPVATGISFGLTEVGIMDRNKIKAEIDDMKFEAANKTRIDEDALTSLKRQGFNTADERFGQ